MASGSRKAGQDRELLMQQKSLDEKDVFLLYILDLCPQECIRNFDVDRWHSIVTVLRRLHPSIIGAGWCTDKSSWIVIGDDGIAGNASLQASHDFAGEVKCLLQQLMPSATMQYMSCIIGDPRKQRMFGSFTFIA